MRNICAALAAALLLALMAACSGTPSGTGTSAPTATSQAGSDASSAASVAEESEGPESAPEDLTPDASSATEVQSAATLSDGEIRPEFQQAMDSYESFFDAYCDFMQRYSESDGTDLSMLADYADMMEQYAQVTSDFNNWNSDDLTTAELSLYLDVQTRVSQKLLETSAG